MRWARDGVGAGVIHTGIRSVKSLLTVTTHVTVVGMDVDPIVVRGSRTFSDATGAMGTTTSSVAEIAIAIVISATMDTGVVTGKQEGGILDTLHTHSHNDVLVTLRMWRNWQTRRSQKPVMVTSWRFKSSHPHQKIKYNHPHLSSIPWMVFSCKNNCHEFSEAGVLVSRGQFRKGSINERRSSSFDGNRHQCCSAS